MSITKNDLCDQCESMQNDILCTLDGLDQEILNNVCQVIVDRMNILKNKLREDVVYGPITTSPSVTAFKCPCCGVGEMIIKVVSDHHTKIGGIPVQIKDARIAECNQCNEMAVSAEELERWEKVQQELKYLQLRCPDCGSKGGYFQCFCCKRNLP